MIRWNNIFFGINKKTLHLFVGEGHLRQDGTIDFHSKSGDKTQEIITAVSTMMRKKSEKQKREKGYFGYDMGMIGKLILVKPGYVMEIRKQREGELTDMPMYLKD
jgi:hypothetical protein